jgi:PPK2 family polyphosphate:nucleotide phosphotransferase
MDISKVLHHCRLKPGTKVDLGKVPADWTGKAFKQLSRDELKEEAQALLQSNLKRLTAAQELLYANDVYSVLAIFQGMDASGKDGMIEHVMSGVNPQGCQVYSFKRPSDEELDHDFLWRCTRCLPERGRIGIFNRSYYEEVLVVKVHPEWLDRQRLPPGKRGHKFWAQRYDDINALEQHLTRSGTLVLKFFLNISRDEQKRRFLDRLNQPAKHWKFNAADVEERAYWKDYMVAYEQALRATTTESAPWHIIPADHKWAARAMVAGILAHTIEELDLKPPRLNKAQRQSLASARRALQSER